MPIEHLANCHGEWNFILQVLAYAPLVGAPLAAWFRARAVRRNNPHPHS